jgi:ketosteroid isomerase-like protein
MSEENVETIRRLWAALDEGGMEAVLPFLDPEVVYEDEVLPDHVGESYRGPEGLSRAWSRWTEPWEAFETELKWARDAGDDEVVSFHHVRARGKGSGVEMEFDYAYVWRLRDGKIVYNKSFADAAEALAAAGLKP